VLLRNISISLNDLGSGFSSHDSRLELFPLVYIFNDSGFNVFLCKADSWRFLIIFVFGILLLVVFFFILLIFLILFLSVVLLLDKVVVMMLVVVMFMVLLIEILCG
jgi:hypothetical protein